MGRASGQRDDVRSSGNLASFIQPCLNPFSSAPPSRTPPPGTITASNRFQLSTLPL
jgi:hypothetical protein